ncbi:MAG TPA: enoyl-CoA hydratase-related protein [Syntrophorhabdaceae bacterium]|nr:enoyl-CoA hydratase-related protein [Syntrophorhabdaceae bacterium]
MNYDDVLLEKNGPIARITINREKAMNALNDGMLMVLDKMFRDFEEDNKVRVVTITGAGEKAFVAGADVKEIKESGKGRTVFITKGQHALSRIRRSGKVVIGQINGYALGGGCELALACDFRIASENAKFGLPEATLGVMAGYGGTQLLSRLVGPGRAKYMMLTGVTLTAHEAYQFGLVEKVCPHDKLRDEVNGLADRIVSCGPLALRGCKRAVDEGLILPLEEALKFELQLYDKVANARDAEEGLSAFLEKRRPVFTGE